jgi:hypothetical protein
MENFERQQYLSQIAEMRKSGLISNDEALEVYAGSKYIPIPEGFSSSPAPSPAPAPTPIPSKNFKRRLSPQEAEFQKQSQWAMPPVMLERPREPDITIDNPKRSFSLLDQYLDIRKKLDTNPGNLPIPPEISDSNIGQEYERAIRQLLSDTKVDPRSGQNISDQLRKARIGMAGETFARGFNPTWKGSGFWDKMRDDAYKAQTQGRQKLKDRVELLELLRQSKMGREKLKYDKSQDRFDNLMKLKVRELEAQGFDHDKAMDIVKKLADIEKAKSTGSKKINTEIRKLGDDLQEFQSLANSINDVEREMGFNLDDYSEGKISMITEMGDKISKDVDVPGVSFPAFGRVNFYDGKARLLYAKISRIFNTELKNRSGAAVTSSELRRLRDEFATGNFNSEQEMIQMLKDYKEAAYRAMNNIQARYDERALKAYEKRGGETSKTFEQFKTPKYGGSKQSTVEAPRQELSPEDREQILKYAQEHGLTFDQAQIVLENMLKRKKRN